MSNNSILLINPNFEPTNSTNLSLLVKIGADTFSYAIVDIEHKLVHAVYDEQECDSGYEKLKERLKTDTYLKLDYKNVKVASHTKNIIFVPQELFNESDVALYTKFFADADSQNVYVQPSLQQNIHTIFSLPQSIEKVIDENWANSTKLQQNAGLVELATKIDTDSIIIDFTVGSFQLSYIRDEKIAFTQSYQFEDVDELTYYILLITTQLSIDTKKTDIKTCGIIHEGDPKWDLLSQYFNKVDLLAVSSDLDTNILDDMPAHYYTSLLSLLQCG
ncbi:DUF3822 family protein [Pedobacter xixiisoli]|uniref:DUF3822 domain-containing protein n=1 Tax=Pedobacter xixiisoli TaxID=1476464 RepID=A0A285ZY11_9SPHI|nr:DUF3822 family protein [Pedobacter xixiisoli]SOD14535.1 Protein of unknown function [Pedobacter xixiisoli]